jgi:hypothetical protein
MKKLTLCLSALLLTTAVYAMENPWNRKLPFKTATVQYNIDGVMKGSKSVYLKDYGRTSAEYSQTSMKIFGMTQKQENIVITTPEWEYTIDMTAKTGVKQANPNKYLIEEFDKLSQSQQKTVVENAEKTGYAMVGGMNGKIEKGAAKILGYLCDKVTLMGMTAYTISGTELPLKVEGNTMGVKMMETAVQISKDAPPSSKFKTPVNIKIEYDPAADQLLKERAKDVIQSLLEGKVPSAAINENGGQTGSEQNDSDQEEQMKKLMQMFEQ